MRIKNLQLDNFRKYRSISLELPDSNFIVLIGGNGVGKSTILDSISIALADIVRQLLYSNSRHKAASFLEQSDINNESQVAEIGLTVEAFGSLLSLKTTKSISQRGSSRRVSSQNILEDVKYNLVNNYSVELPVIVYYRINRTFNISSGHKEKPFYNKLLEGYRDCLSEQQSSFNNFEQWFIAEENLENQMKIASKKWDFEKPNLKVLRQAISSFLSSVEFQDYSKLRVERSTESNLVYSNSMPGGVLVIDKNNETISINQLSSGEKMIVYLVADIARRLLILNGNKEDSLGKNGVVLIDEIEMHLHPTWQRNIVEGLQSTFPNVQFIVSSHSPQLIANLKSENVLNLKGEEISKLNYQSLGVDSNSLLESAFAASDRPRKMEELIEKFHKSIDNESTILDVESKLAAVKQYMSKDSGLMSDSILDELSILLSAYKFDMTND